MGARLAFGVLGPLEVRLDGAAVRVGGPRQRALLGLLLCHANRVVSRDQLIRELLGDQSAATADRLLRVQVSRLRKALADGNGEPRLQARPPGYLLRVEDGELDLHAFEHQIAAGRQALADGDPARAAGRLREAESLWRGRPLADLEFEPASWPVPTLFPATHSPPLTPANSAIRPGPADRAGRRPASHQPGRRRLAVGTARPETHRPGDLGSHRHPQRNRLPVQPGTQLPVQPRLGSTRRPVLDPLTPGVLRHRSAAASR